MSQVLPPALEMLTLILSTGFTVQLGTLPVQPLVIGVSLAGRISYEALYCPPRSSPATAEFSETPAWIRSDVV